MKARLTLDKMVHGGAALARLEDGRIALVRGGFPGEVIEAELSEKSGVLQGYVQAVLTPSPDRIAPSDHPGLDYSHIRYDAQLALKRDVVADALSRSLKQAIDVPPLRAAPALWHYRHAVQPAVAKGGLGYRQPDSHDVKMLAADPVAHESINRFWRLWLGLEPPKGIRELALRCNDQGDLLVCFIASASARNYLAFAHTLLSAGVKGVSYAPYDPRGRFRGGFERLAGERTIRQRYGRFETSVTATSFAQPNPASASLLYRHLESWAGKGQAALDLYAGSGIIGMHLAGTFSKVIALEVDRSSIVRGEREAKRLGIGNLAFIKADAKHIEALPEAELVTVDPPRAGLAKPVREAIIASKAEKLIYVSCDVATWARDVAHFVEAGFTLERLQPYDFYPQTHHIEMLSLLGR